MELRALEPSDLPALAALCQRPDIAAELDAVPDSSSLQSAPGVNTALGAFEGERLVGAAGMTASSRPRLRHLGKAWIAAGPAEAHGLLAALVGLAADWWRLDRLELATAATTRLDAALARAGFEPEVRCRLDRAQPEGLCDTVERAWVRSGLPAAGASPPIPRKSPDPLLQPIVIRPRRLEDAPALARLHDEPSVRWNTVQSPFGSVEAWRERIRADAGARGHNLVALVDDQIAGACMLQGATSPRRRHVWVLGMAVATAWQGRGVGRAMMRHLLSLAAEAGAARVELAVFADNARAISLYSTCGFTREGTKCAHAWREGAFVDSLVMARVG